MDGMYPVPPCRIGISKSHGLTGSLRVLGEMSLGSKCGFSIAMESGCNVSDLMSLILRRDALLFWLTFSFFSLADIVNLRLLLSMICISTMLINYVPLLGSH